MPTFDYPTGVAVAAAGTVYVADAGSQLIRRITPAGRVSTLAGSSLIGPDRGGSGRPPRVAAMTQMPGGTNECGRGRHLARFHVGKSRMANLSSGLANLGSGLPFPGSGLPSGSSSLANLGSGLPFPNSDLANPGSGLPNRSSGLLIRVPVWHSRVQVCQTGTRIGKVSFPERASGAGKEIVKKAVTFSCLSFTYP
ncbi:hypothetical protein [Hymenobacter terricola]|uniref:hypothetical protein n=1 Tax=Hymenobacter terricola TaxID=2819236 RepID=UPI001CF0E7E3|nr:hypothetical protein [Hymenobacter terricola]